MLIDFHYHLADADSAVIDLLADMDQSGVERTLLMGGPTDAYWEYKQCGFAPNEQVAKAVKVHADRLLGNVYIDPREASAMDTLKRYLDQGFRAVKLFRRSASIPTLKPSTRCTRRSSGGACPS